MPLSTSLRLENTSLHVMFMHIYIATYVYIFVGTTDMYEVHMM